MDEPSSGDAPAPEVHESTAPTAMNTTGGDSPQPAENTQAETPTPGNPEPTGPAPETTDPTLPDHGVDPDKGIDPDAGDLPTNPDPPLDSKATDSVDLKGMSRAERAAYFSQIEREQQSQIEATVTQNYQPQDVQALRDYYMEQGADEFQALSLARQDVAEQKAQISEAIAQITQLNANLQVDSFEARQSYDWMNPAKEGNGYSKETHEAAAKLYEQMITTDERTGQIVDAKMSPKQLAGIIDTIRQDAMKQATMTAQKNAEQQMAAVAPPSSQTRTRSTPFDNLSAQDMRAQLLAKGINVT